MANGPQGPDQGHPIWQEGLLALGFLALIAAAVVTVMLPELSDAPIEEPKADAGVPTDSE